MGADEFRAFVEDKYGKESNQYAALGKASTDWQDEISVQLSVPIIM